MPISNPDLVGVLITGNTSGVTAPINYGTLTLAGGANITLSQAGNAVTISGNAGGGGTGVQALGAGTSTSTGSISISAGTGIVVSSSGASVISIGTSGSVVNSIGAAGSLSSGPITITGGNNINVSSGTAAGIILISDALASKITMTQNFSFEEIDAVVTSGSWTAGTTNSAFGSVLYLHRIFIPAAMSLTEFDIAQNMALVSSSGSGAGSMSQSVGLFSISASTKLVNVFSASSAWAWGTGSSSASFTECQNGWTGMLVHSMGLSSGSAGTSTISAGEYVVGLLVNVSASATAAAGAGGSNMSMSLYGNQPMAGLAQSTLGAMSSAPGLSAGSFIGTTGSVNVLSAAGLSAGSFVGSVGTTGLATVFSAGGLSAGSFVGTTTGTGLASVISNSGTLSYPVLTTAGSTSFSVLTGGTASFTALNGVSLMNSNYQPFQIAGINVSNSAFSWLGSASAAATSGSGTSQHWTVHGTASANLTYNWISTDQGTSQQVIASATTSAAAYTATGNAAYTAFTGGTATITAFSAAPTVASVVNSAGLASVSAMTASTAVTALISGGLAAVSAFTATTATGAMASSGLAAVSALTASTNTISAVTNVSAVILSNFLFQGTGTAYTGTPNNFTYGVMATAAMPAAITLSSTAVTLTGSAAAAQPWFALIGS